MAHTIETRLVDKARTDCHIVINGKVIKEDDWLSVADAEVVRYWLTQRGLEETLKACEQPAGSEGKDDDNH